MLLKQYYPYEQKIEISKGEIIKDVKTIVSEATKDYKVLENVESHIVNAITHNNIESKMIIENILNKSLKEIGTTDIKNNIITKTIINSIENVNEEYNILNHNKLIKSMPLILDNKEKINTSIDFSVIKSKILDDIKPIIKEICSTDNLELYNKLLDKINTYLINIICLDCPNAKNNLKNLLMNSIKDTDKPISAVINIMNNVDKINNEIIPNQIKKDEIISDIKTINQNISEKDIIETKNNIIEVIKKENPEMAIKVANNIEKLEKFNNDIKSSIIYNTTLIQPSTSVIDDVKNLVSNAAIVQNNNDETTIKNLTNNIENKVIKIITTNTTDTLDTKSDVINIVSDAVKTLGHNDAVINSTIIDIKEKINKLVIKITPIMNKIRKSNELQNIKDVLLSITNDNNIKIISNLIDKIEQIIIKNICDKTSIDRLEMENEIINLIKQLNLSLVESNNIRNNIINNIDKIILISEFNDYKFNYQLVDNYDNIISDIKSIIKDKKEINKTEINVIKALCTDCPEAKKDIKEKIIESINNNQIANNIINKIEEKSIILQSEHNDIIEDIHNLIKDVNSIIKEAAIKNNNIDILEQLRLKMEYMIIKGVYKNSDYTIKYVSTIVLNALKILENPDNIAEEISNNILNRLNDLAKKIGEKNIFNKNQSYIDKQNLLYKLNKINLNKIIEEISNNDIYDNNKNLLSNNDKILISKIILSSIENMILDIISKIDATDKDYVNLVLKLIKLFKNKDKMLNFINNIINNTNFINTINSSDFNSTEQINNIIHEEIIEMFTENINMNNTNIIFYIFVVLIILYIYNKKS
jgi:hypothetical protein